MRIPLTRYGLPQVLIFPLVLLALMAALFIAFGAAIWLIPVEAFLFIVLCWLLSFFRDPRRKIVQDEAILYSPADATITEIAVVEHDELGGKTLKISMFLSVFNVHVNRLPCSARIDKVVYKKGQFKNAMSPEASRDNESNDVYMTRLSEPKDKLLVRQITGAVARRIVCEAKENSEYRQGETYGMMKFGSRAELYLPAGEGSFEKGFDRFELCVKIGDPVRAGITPLVRYVS